MGKRVFRFICPYCKRPYASGSYFIEAKAERGSFFLAEQITPSCCQRELNTPTIFQLRSLAQQKIREVRAKIKRRRSYDFLVFLPQEKVFKKLLQ